MPVKCTSLYTPLLYSKKGYTFVLSFDPKHTLWVLVRTASVKIIIKFSNKIFNFCFVKKSLFIAWTSFRNRLESRAGTCDGADVVSIVNGLRL